MTLRMRKTIRVCAWIALICGLFGSVLKVTVWGIVCVIWGGVVLTFVKSS